MIAIEEIAEVIRKHATQVVKPVVDEDSRRPAEVQEKENNVRLLVEPAKALKPFEKASEVRPYFNLYALDSSSRALDTPYFFIAIATGTLVNRFTGKTIDCPPVSLLQGSLKDSCRFLSVIPNFESSVEFEDRFSNLLFTKNIIGEKYDHLYNKYVLLDETRLLVESHLLIQGMSKGLLDESIILIDGPLIYPSFFESSISGHTSRIDSYKASIEAINEERVSVWKDLRKRRSRVVGIVKRLYRSYYLSACDPLEIGFSNLNDEAYLSAVSRRFSIEEGLKPYLLGPLKIESKVKEVKVERIAWYLGIPRRSFSSRTPLTNYTHYRVETVADSVLDETVLSPVIYDSLSTGTILPISIMIADYRARKLSSIISHYLVYSMGLGEASVYQYLSI
ncbi:MAG: DNA double-strand break repair nuclease NurA [Thermosphaera sp.]